MIFCRPFGGLRRLTRRQLLWCCAVLLAGNLLLTVVLAVSMMSHRRALDQQQEALSAQVGITPAMDAERQEEQFAIAVGESSRAVTMHSEITVQGSQIPIWLSNSDENTCAVAVTLELAESGQILAASGPVDPGWHLENLELEQKLEPGIYQCYARCAFYTMEDDLLLGHTVRQILLTVK